MLKLYAFTFLLFLSSTLLAQLHDTASELPCLEKEFNLFVHIGTDRNGSIEILEESIVDAVDTLNTYFAPICVSFQVCEIEYMENPNFNTPTQGHLYEEMGVAHGRMNKLDLFIINLEFFENYFVLDNITDDSEGYLYVDKFNLKHISQGMGRLFTLGTTYNKSAITSELVDGSNCTMSADQFCDTPADPFNRDTTFFASFPFAWHRDCEFTSELLDSNGEYYSPDVGNIMSAYHTCWCGFSREQFLQMVDAIKTSPNRFW